MCLRKVLLGLVVYFHENRKVQLCFNTFLINKFDALAYLAASRIPLGSFCIGVTHANTTNGIPVTLPSPVCSNCLQMRSVQWLVQRQEEWIRSSNIVVTYQKNNIWWDFSTLVRPGLRTLESEYGSAAHLWNREEVYDLLLEPLLLSFFCESESAAYSLAGFPFVRCSSIPRSFFMLVRASSTRLFILFQKKIGRRKKNIRAVVYFMCHNIVAC